MDSWVLQLGLDPANYGTHTLRRTKATLIYRRTKNLRAVQLLLGHSKLESTVRYLGIEVDDALEMVTKSEVRAQSALDKSYEKVNDQEIKFNNDAAHQTYNVAIAKADGNRKVALATCESQSGDAQKACKDQAEADYKTARADAKASAEAAVQQR